MWNVSEKIENDFRVFWFEYLEDCSCYVLRWRKIKIEISLVGKLRLRIKFWLWEVNEYLYG